MVIGRKGFAGRKMPAESAFRAFVFSAHRDGFAAVSKDFGHARIYPFFGGPVLAGRQPRLVS
jgi:hypothetical protein